MSLVDGIKDARGWSFQRLARARGIRPRPVFADILYYIIQYYTILYNIIYSQSARGIGLARF